VKILSISRRVSSHPDLRCGDWRSLQSYRIGDAVTAGGEGSRGRLRLRLLRDSGHASTDVAHAVVADLGPEIRVRFPAVEHDHVADFAVNFPLFSVGTGKHPQGGAEQFVLPADPGELASCASWPQARHKAEQGSHSARADQGDDHQCPCRESHGHSMPANRCVSGCHAQQPGLVPPVTCSCSCCCRR
jgi:hypothetical protein